MTTNEDRQTLENIAQQLRDLADLTDTRDRAIRAAIENGFGPTELARIFGLTRARIHQIRDGR